MRLCCVWSCVLAACSSGDRAERPADAGALYASDASATSNGGDADTGAGACGHDCSASFANTANHLAIDNRCVYVISFVDFSSGNLMAVAR